LADGRHGMYLEIKDRLAKEIPPADLDAMARYYTTVVQGLSIQARDGATRPELETVITCAMAAWETLTSSRGEWCGPEPRIVE
ncbi:MAG TPA: hypothetical protein VG497_17240, partial [Kribbella sp.]|nr:hypothetical protein [Kribbella sp.]